MKEPQRGDELVNRMWGLFDRNLLRHVRSEDSTFWLVNFQLTKRLALGTEREVAIFTPLNNNALVGSSYQLFT